MRGPYKRRVPKREWEHGFAYATFVSNKPLQWEDYPKKFEDATGCFLQMLYFIYKRAKAGSPVVVYYQLYLKGPTHVQNTD